MPRLSRNQNGFGAIEVLLSLIFVLLAVFVGYYAYHSQHNTTPNKTASSTTATTTKPKVTTSSPSTPVATASQANLQVFMIKTCGSANGAAINALFANTASQNVDTDNVLINGNYAVANVACTLDTGTTLGTEYMKFSSGAWDLVVKTATEVSCDFLTQQGFPDNLKANVCSNGQQQFN